MEEIAREIFREPFDLLQGPLYRVVLLSRSVDDHVLVFAIHHAIADGWTLGVFVQELCVGYLQHVRGVTDALPPVTLSLQRVGRGRARVLAAGGIGIAHRLLEVAPRGASAHLECAGGTGHRVGRASADDHPLSRRTGDCRARSRPPQRRDAFQHLARRVSSRLRALDRRG